MSAYEEGPPRLARRMYLRFALAALVIVLATAGTVATGALLQVKGFSDTFDELSVPIPGIAQDGVLDDVDPGGPQTILILGSDRRFVDAQQGNPVRSDTIILLRLDPGKGVTSVMSIPRDLKVKIPGHADDKINAAYAEGGPQLSVRTVRGLLDIPINHVVNVNFGGFRRAVNRLGCVYADVDRHYFNDNNPPNGGGTDYAVIDVDAGYQKLCGQDALDFVRYRHFDTDLVRAARQQDFLRQAKEQIGASKVFGDREELLRIFARYTQTDIRGTAAILRLLKLTLESAKNPIQEIHFPFEQSGDYLEVRPAQLRQARARFLGAQASAGARGTVKKSSSDRRLERRQSKRRSGSTPPGLFAAGRASEDEAVRLSTKLPLPVYYPKLAVVGSRQVTSDTRAYTITDRGGRRHKAYRMVYTAPGLGQYYGVQGTDWLGPPILATPSETRRVDGRRLQLFYDGNRLRLVSWRAGRAVYWISNTLLQSLTNQQMLGLASSLARPGT